MEAISRTKLKNIFRKIKNKPIFQFNPLATDGRAWSLFMFSTINEDSDSIKNKKNHYKPKNKRYLFT